MYHDPLDSPVEALANTLTHGLGLLLSAAGSIVLMTLAVLRGNVWDVAGCAIYSASLTLVYLTSTVYHSASAPRLRRIFRAFDHSAIYLLIAGTYTPFATANLQAGTGWILFASVWAFAFAGIAFTCLALGRYPIFATTLYVAMGVVILFFGRSSLLEVSAVGFRWLIAGGLFYLAGIFFFASRRIAHAHAIWHLFVMVGSACHYWAVLHYALPSAG